MSLTRIDFPVLARGMNREAPFGSLNPNATEGPLWREMQNLVPHEGALRRREAVVEATGGLPTFLDDEDQFVVGLFEVSPDAENERWLLVTSRELFLGNLGSWTNLTPVYETGTVAITSGTDAVTGTSTEWDDRRIMPGQQIELPADSGDWYEIESVGSNTSITLATNYTGSTLSGDDYSIRRTFRMNDGNPVFAIALNGDLYVAGRISSGILFGSTPTGDGGVLKITGGATLAKTSFAVASDVTFLTSGEAEVASGVDYLTEWVGIRGFTVLSDGRLVLLAGWVDFSVPQSADNRVYYSSHLNLAVWTSSPGGFTDIADFDGICTAMTGGARGVLVHFADGIEIGDLTGAQDPPLRFRPSSAHVGAVGPRMVQTIPGGAAIPPGDIFIAADAGAYYFNGGEATPISWAGTRADLAALDKEDLHLGFSRFDSFRRYVSFFVGGTKEFRLYYDLGAYVKCSYSFPLTAAATPLFEGGGDSRSDRAGYLGVARFNGVTETNLLYEIVDGETVDELPDTTSLGGVFATSDFLADPTRRWAVSHIDLYYTAAVSSTQTTFAVRAIFDGTTESLAVSPVSVSGAERVVTAYPTEQSARGVQVGVALTTEDATFFLRLTRMTVWLADVGEARAA